MFGVENHEVEACFANYFNQEWVIGLCKHPENSFMIL